MNSITFITLSREEHSNCLKAMEGGSDAIWTIGFARNKKCCTHYRWRLQSPTATLQSRPKCRVSLLRISRSIVEPRCLKIAGKRESKEEEKKGNKVIRSEWSADQILRAVDLPADVDTAKVERDSERWHS